MRDIPQQPLMLFEPICLFSDFTSLPPFLRSMAGQSARKKEIILGLPDRHKCLLVLSFFWNAESSTTNGNPGSRHPVSVLSVPHIRAEKANVFDSFSLLSFLVHLAPNPLNRIAKPQNQPHSLGSALLFRDQPPPSDLKSSSLPCRQDTLQLDCSAL